MDKRYLLRTWEKALMIALSLCFLSATWAQSESTRLSTELIRLHVLADSNESVEQAIKYEVRDSVLAYIAPKVEGADDATAAETVIAANIEGIEAAAREAAQGRSVSVTLSEEHYPTRDYGEFSLPAGKYNSLRITLGTGSGDNWWCVVFPPVCDSSDEVSQALETLYDEDMAILAESEGGTEYRFKLVELWGNIKNALQS